MVIAISGHDKNRKRDGEQQNQRKCSPQDKRGKAPSGPTGLQNFMRQVKGAFSTDSFLFLKLLESLQD